MITPKRFGLKYTPIPTLALEYECEAAEREDTKTPSRCSDEGQAVSLFVYRNEANDLRCRKLHVVELPTLTKASEASKIIQQLQTDNQQFLAPWIVKESQLRSLLERLIEHLQPPADATASDAREPSSVSPLTEAAADHESEAEGEESAMEESVVSLEAFKAEEEESQEAEAAQKPTQSGLGTFLSQVSENDDEQESALPANEKHGELEPKPALHEDDELEKAKEKENHSDDEQGDTAKKAALKSDAEVSEEEDIQSEDLEYFSEDASDEDSF